MLQPCKALTLLFLQLLLLLMCVELNQWLVVTVTRSIAFSINSAVAVVIVVVEGVI